MGGPSSANTKMCGDEEENEPTSFRGGE